MPVPWKTLAVGSAGLAVLGVAAALGERRLLAALDATPAPDGWITPSFPLGPETMVPTDDGAELMVASAGPDDAPTVVLVHGLTSNHHDWGPVARRLVDADLRVLGVNQRGHGGSTVGSEGFGPQRQGADLAQVLTGMDLTEVTLVGHSLGGVAAMMCALDHPRRIRGIVLIATLADATNPRRRAALRLAAQPERAISQHPAHAAAVARWAFGATPSRVLVDAALASSRACPEASRRGAARGLVGFDIGDRLGDIARPTLVICGTRDLLTPCAENAAIAEAIPGARFEVIADAGHLVIWEAPDRLAALISHHTHHPVSTSS